MWRGTYTLRTTTTVSRRDAGHSGDRQGSPQWRLRHSNPPRIQLGGAAALKVATKLNAMKINVDFALTCDPVEKGINPFTHPWSTGGQMSAACPANVLWWEDYYQQFDTDSLSFLNFLHLPPELHPPTNIWGRTVKGDPNHVSNTEVKAADFAADPQLGPLGANVTTPKANIYIQRRPSWPRRSRAKSAHPFVEGQVRPGLNIENSYHEHGKWSRYDEQSRHCRPVVPCDSGCPRIGPTDEDRACR